MCSCVLWAMLPELNRVMMMMMIELTSSRPDGTPPLAQIGLGLAHS